LADYTGAFSVTRSVLDPVALLAVGFLFLLFLLLLGTLRRSRLVAFAGLWIAITLLPVSHLIPFPEMMAEHYLYLPSFGFCLLVALAFTRLMESPQSTIHNPELGLQTTDNWQLTTGNWWRVAMGGGLLMALLTFYAARTVIRNRDWRDDLTFYVRVVGDNPYSARARLGLGYAYDRSGLPRLAVVQYQAGLRIDPQDPRLYTNMGAAYQKLKMLAEAEKAYLTALQLCPQDSATLNNLGFLYTEQGEFDKARSSLEQAERLSRGQDPAVYANFGLLHELSGKLPEALKAYRKARALTPANSFLSGKIAALEKQLSS
ncbi:MAG: tetratricopeptide repeat protein, partial [Candidatus Binatia bacterium]